MPPSSSSVPCRQWCPGEREAKPSQAPGIPMGGQMIRESKESKSCRSSAKPLTKSIASSSQRRGGQCKFRCRREQAVDKRQRQKRELICLQGGFSQAAPPPPPRTSRPSALQRRVVQTSPNTLSLGALSLETLSHAKDQSQAKQSKASSPRSLISRITADWTGLRVQLSRHRSQRRPLTIS